MSLHDSGLVNHIITNRHKEDINICNFQENEVEDHCISWIFATMHVQSLRTAYFSREHNISREEEDLPLVQLSMRTFSSPQQFSVQAVQDTASIRHVWGSRRQGGRYLSKANTFQTWKTFFWGGGGEGERAETFHSLLRLGDNESCELPRMVKQAEWSRGKQVHVVCFKPLSFSTLQVKHCCSYYFMIKHRAQRAFKSL